MSKTDQRKRHRRNSNSDSDNDQSRPKKIYADGYDEDYRGNADDRVWLSKLSEREREAELLKRHEQREILNHREEISKKLKSKIDESKLKSDDDTDNETKPKSTSTLLDNDIYAEDDEDDNRLSSNHRKQVNASKQKETQHSKTLQTLVEERRKKQDEKTKKTLPKPGDLSSSDDEIQEKSSKKGENGKKLLVADVYQTSSSESDDDDDDDNNNNNNNRGTRRRRSRSPDERNKHSKDQQESKRKKCTPITSKSQLKSMVLSRFRMEKWCHAPFFSNVAKGAFVRINIGQNNGSPVYRVCEIRDVVETGKIYNLGATRTNKGLRLKHGHNERVFRLEFVSNSEISDAEFKRWRETTIKQGISLPTLEDVENKIKAIDKCKHYVYNNNEITKIVEEKNRFRKAPINYAMSKNELLKEIDMAKDENDSVTEKELRKKLEDMEQRAKELDRNRSQNISALAEINQRNRKSTQANIEMALLREAQENKNAKPDPFTRRRCAPVLVARAAQTKEELIRELHSQRVAEEEAAEAKKKAAEQRLLGEKNNTKKTVVTKTITKIQTTIDEQFPENGISSMTTHERGSFTLFTENNDEMFASHDFELDFTI
ncbi:unnamed protein product [Adineta steineri]|uniref:Plus3 domain-containing protein n=1 Tax=Adineta steineri TaxID=433720 RepID=A0A815QKK7_9BILA|nr:unnamed protein product [Adineta steineri]